MEKQSNTEVMASADILVKPSIISESSAGASEASKLGAVASLIGSVTPFSMSTLHTGWQDYEDGVTPIPTACITKEDAKLLQRYQVKTPKSMTPSHHVKAFQDRGEKIVVKLNMSYTRFTDSTSRNSVAEIEGKSRL